MNADKNKDQSHDRKDFRRKSIKNKSLDKRERYEDDYYAPKARKQIKKKMQDMQAEEIWEDWENNYDS